MVDVVTRPANIDHAGTLICIEKYQFEIFNVPDINHIRFTQEAQQGNSYTSTQSYI